MSTELIFALASGLFALGYGVGRWREYNHFRSIIRREGELADIKVTNLRHVPDPQTVDRCSIVTGDAVIATDYFKSFAASIRNIIGGEKSGGDFTPGPGGHACGGGMCGCA